MAEEGRGETASQFCRRTSQLNGAARGCVSLSLRSEAKVKSLSLSLLLERGKQRVERERGCSRDDGRRERERGCLVRHFGNSCQVLA